jgi:hypothetical protein
MRANPTPFHRFLRNRTARIRFLAAAFAVLCALAPGLATAKIPYPALCTVPDHILLVGCGPNGAADPAGTITCVIRNLQDFPEPQAMVILDFSQTPDMEPSMVQPDPGVYGVFCQGGSRYVQALTDMQGSVTFRLVGCALRSTASGAHGPTLIISADGVQLRVATVSAFDLDGAQGVGPTDLTAFLQDFFSGQYWARADYDGDGTLGPNDLSVWVQDFFSGNSVQGGSMAGCP